MELRPDPHSAGPGRAAPVSRCRLMAHRCRLLCRVLRFLAALPVLCFLRARAKNGTKFRLKMSSFVIALEESDEIELSNCRSRLRCSLSSVTVRLAPWITTSDSRGTRDGGASENSSDLGNRKIGPSSRVDCGTHAAVVAGMLSTTSTPHSVPSTAVGKQTHFDPLDSTRFDRASLCVCERCPCACGRATPIRQCRSGLRGPRLRKSVIISPPMRFRRESPLRGGRCLARLGQAWPRTHLSKHYRNILATRVAVEIQECSTGITSSALTA